MHVPWCLHIAGVEHRRDQPWHQHWPKKGMGAGRTEARIVAVLCSYCSDRVDNTPNWDNAVSPGLDGQDEYTLWNTCVEGGWNKPLIARTLEAGSAAAEEVIPVVPVVPGDGRPDSAAAPPVSPLPIATSRSERRRFTAQGADFIDQSPASAKSSADEVAYPRLRLGPTGGGAPAKAIAVASSAEPFSLDSWQQEGKRLAEMGHMLQGTTSMWRWEVGGWFIRGEDALGEEVYGHIDLVGFSGSALRQYAWVAAKVTPDTRVPELDWTHHRVVAALPAPEQGEWLKKAKEENLNSGALHRAIHGEKPRVRRWTLEELREAKYGTEKQRVIILAFLDWLEAK